MSKQTVRATNLGKTQVLFEDADYRGEDSGFCCEETPICPKCHKDFKIDTKANEDFASCPHCKAVVFFEVREVTSYVWWTSLDGPSVEPV